MAKIQLTNGGIALIDDEDLERVTRHRWYRWHHPGGPVYVRRTGDKLGLHNFVTGAKGVDHINGNGLDNRRSNLRVCTQAENQQNRRQNLTRRSSRYKGVSWDKARNRWTAQICAKSLGRFTDEEDAARAYDDAARRRFGEFARLNFPLTGEQSALWPTPHKKTA